MVLLAQELAQDRFAPGVRSLGLAEEGLALGPFDEALVSPAMLSRLSDLRAEIISGQIVVSIEE